MSKPEFISEKDYEKLCDICFAKASAIKEQNIRPASEMDIFDLTDLMITLELEKIEKNILSDSSIDYNDEIVEIKKVGILPTVDITVTGDNLFYCNGILTKNSIGLPATLDAFFALITSEELESLGQLMIKQLKNRWGDLSYYRRFVVGIDRSKMKLFNLEDTAQGNIQVEKKDDKPVFDKTSFSEDWEGSFKKSKKKSFDIGELS